jgi:hypothetical protein
LGKINKVVENGCEAPVFSKNDSTIRFFISSGMQNLYCYAYGNRDVGTLEVIDELKGESYEEVRKQAYSYELVIMDTSYSKAYKKMREDLDGYFAINSFKREELTKVLILRKANSSIDIRSGLSGPQNSYTIENGIRYLRNYSLFSNTPSKNWYHIALPFLMINESGYTDKVNFQLPEHFTTIERLNEVLESSGLILTIEDRPIQKIVLSNPLFDKS